MYETGFIKNQKYCNLVVSKGSSNVCSKCTDANFHTTFGVYVSADKYVVPPLLILPGNMVE